MLCEFCLVDKDLADIAVSNDWMYAVCYECKKKHMCAKCDGLKGERSELCEECFEKEFWKSA